MAYSIHRCIGAALEIQQYIQQASNIEMIKDWLGKYHFFYNAKQDDICESAGCIKGMASDTFYYDCFRNLI